MSSIRKIKRRAMARLSEPVLTLTLPVELFAGLSCAERDHLIRRAMREFVKPHRRAATKEGAKE